MSQTPILQSNTFNSFKHTNSHTLRDTYMQNYKQTYSHWVIIPTYDAYSQINLCACECTHIQQINYIQTLYAHVFLIHDKYINITHEEL